MTTTQLAIAVFLGSALNTLFWGAFSVLARIYVHYREKPYREKLQREQEAFARLLSGAYGNSQFNDFDTDKPESVN